MTNRTRRKFIQQSAYTMLAASMPLACSRKALPSNNILMKHVNRCKISLPCIGLGTGITFEVGESQGERNPIREVLRTFHENGGVLLDTSTSYGSAESVIGELSTELGINDNLFYATKVSTHGDGGIKGPLQFIDSQERLKQKIIDLLQVHELRDYKEHLVMIERLKAEGLVRFSGLTIALSSQLDELYNIMRTRDDIDFIQLNYSIATRSAEERILPLALDKGMGVLINRPFEGSGLFARISKAPLPDWATEFDCTSWAQFFLKFIISHPAVTCPLPATKKIDHIIDNMRSGLGIMPDMATRKKMITYFESLA